MSFKEYGEIISEEKPKFKEFGEIIQENAKKKYIGEEIPGQLLAGAATGALGGPGSIGEFFNRLLDLLPQSEKAKEIRRDVGKYLFPGLHGPTIEQTKELEKVLFGEKTQPTTPVGRIARRGGEFAGMGATTGGISPSSLLLSATSGAAGQVIRESGFPEEVATAAELLAPLATKGSAKIISPAKEGALRDVISPTKREFYDRAKKLGLTDKEITPLIQEGKVKKFLKPVAKKTEGVSESLKETHSKLSNVINDVKKEVPKTPISHKEVNGITESLGNILSELEHSPGPSTDKQQAINYLTKTIENINNKGITERGLLDLYRDINEMGLYEKLEPVKNIIKTAFKKTNHSVANKFEFTNKMYSNLKNLEKEMGIGNFENLLKFGEAAGLISSLGSELIFGTGGSVAGAILGEKLIRGISTKMLTDPRWQGILRSTAKAAKNNSRSSAISAYNQLKEKIKKDFPEDYEEIDWPE